MRGSASRTHAASAARSDCSSLISSFTFSSATARARPSPLTTASADGRKAQRATVDPFWRAAYVSASAARRLCMSFATFERASG